MQMAGGVGVILLQQLGQLGGPERFEVLGVEAG
jgi:hypothetical protein